MPTNNKDIGDAKANVRRKIFIPMVLLTAGCGIAVLVSSIFIFNRGVTHAVYEKNASAEKVVRYEIERLKTQVYLDNPEFAEHLKNLTGCEIMFFRDDINFSSTLSTEDGTPLPGARLTERISGPVLAGATHIERLNLFGKNMLTKYIPLAGEDGEIIGIVFIGNFTGEETQKLFIFMLTGIFITLGVMGIFIIIARTVSGGIERRLAVADLLLKTEEQDKTITESIHYANKIKTNLLPGKNIFDEAFSDYSVIWKPRDTVGGVYWAKNFKEGTVLCVCGCTGHGTPGAMLTVLAVSAFESLITEKKYKDTAEILCLLDQRLSSILHGNNDSNDGTEISDGFNLAVMYISKDGSAAFSAGNTNVFICDGKTITRHEGQPILIGEGKAENKDRVKVIPITANPDNKFYIIGGEKNNPFGYKEFEKIILENHHEKQTVISGMVWDAFEDYQGDEAQRDDFGLISFVPKIKEKRKPRVRKQVQS
jgi:hypothetical protein